MVQTALPDLTGTSGAACCMFDASPSYIDVSIDLPTSVRYCIKTAQPDVVRLSDVPIAIDGLAPPPTPDILKCGIINGAAVVVGLLFLNARSAWSMLFILRDFTRYHS